MEQKYAINSVDKEKGLDKSQYWIIDKNSKVIDKNQQQPRNRRKFSQFDKNMSYKKLVASTVIFFNIFIRV